jgi:hypothetical protein
VITTPLAFLARFPEFAKAGEARIQAALDDAAAQTDATVFGTLTDRAQSLLAAHYLAGGPSGREARPKDVESKTVYLTAREEIELTHCGGYGAAP